jgi:hypothetical protein
MKKSLVQNGLMSLASSEMKPKIIAVAVNRPFMSDGSAESPQLTVVFKEVVITKIEENTAAHTDITNFSVGFILTCLINGSLFPQIRVYSSKSPSSFVYVQKSPFCTARAGVFASLYA